MTAGPKDPKDDDDLSLWARVTEDLTPLKKKPPPTDEKPVKATPQAKPKPAPKKHSKPASVPPPPPPVAKPVVQPGQMEARRVRRLGRGDMDIDARIDLHGMTQREAHSRLLVFLKGAQQRGSRNVLVITGKGKAGNQAPKPGQEAPGVIRRNIRHWLNEPGFAEIVSAYSSAGRRHGGEGALYVQIRRIRG